MIQWNSIYTIVISFQNPFVSMGVSQNSKLIFSRADRRIHKAINQELRVREGWKDRDTETQICRNVETKRQDS